MATKLYVGGVSYGSTEDGLREAFAQAGNVVSAKIIIDKMTGRSRGFAFVEMGSEEDAQKAIALWNGKELDGRTLTVNEARPMEERAPRTGGNRDYNNGGGNQGGNQGGSW
jgi:RNA recognition motif-containing protein